MNKRNNNILFGCFVGAFIVAFIWLYNFQELSNKQSFDSNTVNLGETNYGFLEKRQNPNTSNYVRIPSYQKKSNSRFGENQSELNSLVNMRIENPISANYEVNIDKKGSIIGKKSNFANNFISEVQHENYSSPKSEYKSSNNDNAQLAQAINQLAALNVSKSATSIQSSSSNIKTDHGFMAMNTDISSIENSLNINDNALQKSTNDINPGDDGEMGNPIPVGDGWVFMFMLALVYCGLKGLKI